MAITYDHKGKSLGQPGTSTFFHRVTYAVGGDNYATNGLLLDWTDTNLDGELVDKTILAVIHLGGAGYHTEYDYIAGKLKVFYSDNNAVADGPLIEYPDATGLTATFQLMVVAV